jgi:hypothetical protein
MNFDFQHILKRAGLLMVEMQPIKSGLIAISAIKPVANGQIGLNCVATFYERRTPSYFGDWVTKIPVKPRQAKSSQIKPNQARRMAWISPARFKTGMEARNP